MLIFSLFSIIHSLSPLPSLYPTPSLSPLPHSLYIACSVVLSQVLYLWRIVKTVLLWQRASRYDCLHWRLKEGVCFRHSTFPYPFSPSPSLSPFCFVPFFLSLSSSPSLPLLSPSCPLPLFPSFSFLPLLPFQLRVHVTVDSIFYLHVTSRAIIEDCSHVKFAPYAWTYPGIQDHFKVQENSHAPSGRINTYL